MNNVDNKIKQAYQAISIHELYSSNKATALYEIVREGLLAAEREITRLQIELDEAKGYDTWQDSYYH